MTWPTSIRLAMRAFTSINSSGHCLLLTYRCWRTFGQCPSLGKGLLQECTGRAANSRGHSVCPLQGTWRSQSREGRGKSRADGGIQVSIRPPSRNRRGDRGAGCARTNGSGGENVPYVPRARSKHLPPPVEGDGAVGRRERGSAPLRKCRKSHPASWFS